VRTCSAGVFKNAERTGRPCLLGYIGKCSAPCANWGLPPVGLVKSSLHVGAVMGCGWRDDPVIVSLLCKVVRGLLSVPGRAAAR
ncbi:hypothetical protein, partial [Streptomyces sp. NPDC047070]|uniref:hypothetical protein n=1 Tax=Streptomyces sp. NPDC047070 TaxID=3154923 RepID=UPI0034528509